ncbi:hypothetical protein D9619_005925 [Psilocybe cf. subviscida]|uniref:Uncharacterized protein n=1 Tax=Psilocybe cf. subviscida TaxID=2480587 RepID=A0A8H5FB85_9AGAR|nr:hypothetical protein D9619_005925 [Psilocybe cf. subviscida]
MATLIPQKYWRWHSELHKSMKQTHRTKESFEKFKYLVKHHACILDKTKKKDEQDMEAWDAYLAQILAVQPDLAMYQDFWPIQSYWETCVRTMWCRKKSRSQSSTQQREDSPEIVFVKQTFSKISGNISANASSGQRVYPPFSRHDAACTPRSQSDAFKRQTNTATHFLPPASQLSSRTASSSGSKFASASCNSFRDIYYNNEEEIEAAAISCCPLCGPPDRVDPWMNEELRHCLSHDESLLTTLADGGILFDQHLHLLCKLAKEDWEIFLGSIPSSEMRTDEKADVLEALTKAATRRANAECIPSPSALVELEIINPALEGSQAALQNAMRLQDQYDVFQDIWSVMKLESVPFLQKAHPDIGDLGNAICNMLRERPFFAKYDNFWPIRLYLLRMQSIANVRPIYRTDEEQLLFIEAFVEECGKHTKPRSTTTTIIQIPCRRHNPLDLSLVQEPVRADLQARGLGELIPVMPYLAVINEDELAAFARYSEAEKDEVMNLSGVKLTRFQKFVLKNSFV